MDINSKTDGAVFLSTPSVWRATTSSAFPASTPMIFLSTPSVWRATWSFNRLPLFVHLFLSTPSVWRATPSPDQCPPARWNFYPRPPCGGRLWPESRRLTGCFISIHALRVEGDPPCMSGGRTRFLPFLSTPSVWRATTMQDRKDTLQGISIHALLAESDSKMLQKIGSFCSQTCYTTITIRDF